MKRIIITLITFIILMFPAKKAFAADSSPIKLYFFSSSGCMHCKEEREFLDKLSLKYPGLEVHEFDIKNPENLVLLQRIGKELNADVSGTPRTFVGEKFIRGYLNDETTGKQIEEAILCHIETACPDLVNDFLQGNEIQASQVVKDTSANKVSLPLFGQVNLKEISLPVLTFMVALLDGFNPCAMWTLVFLISLLLGLKNRKRMWVLGASFIFTSGLVYFLFLSAWLNFFLFLRYAFWIRVLIGSIALGAAIYNIRDFWVNKDGGCKASEGEKRKEILVKLKHMVEQKSFWLALGGIMLLAALVNMVELVCSAGLPAIYTQVLSLSSLPTWQYYLYLVLYVFIFMLDDLIVFFVAMKTLQLAGTGSKYSRYSRLVGGLLMLVIGLLLIFKPELLMFG